MFPLYIGIPYKHASKEIQSNVKKVFLNSQKNNNNLRVGVKTSELGGSANEGPLIYFSGNWQSKVHLACLCPWRQRGKQRLLKLLKTVQHGGMWLT